jgi:hypothetical protein
VDEVSAFLTGRLTERGGALVWVRLNWPAYAEPGFLVHRCEVERRSSPDRPVSWARTRSDRDG